MGIPDRRIKAAPFAGMIDAWLAENGGARRFAMGESGDDDALAAALQRAGYAVSRHQ